ncbi:hypothetical protein BDN72DRAFT_906360 [Pluteus cervinus]|uniref:Uncharacterized protein n=1 Tax=Pluteus cervinus TaxID=181527 RepID=A0ACD2ZZK2_9AGAR|nr:hypothetical protein BDN72DRAFT_906360 [Pluteus cervinus]
MAPGTKNTARDICSRDWCLANPGGTSKDFREHWLGLSEEFKSTYTQKSKEMAKASKANTTTTAASSSKSTKTRGATATTTNGSA